MRTTTRILTIIIRKMGKLNTHSPIYCMKDNWQNWLNLRHARYRMYLTSMLDQYLQIVHNERVRCENKWTRSSGQNVFHYLPTSQDWTVIKDRMPSLLGIYLKLQAHDGTTTSGTTPRKSLITMGKVNRVIIFYSWKQAEIYCGKIGKRDSKHVIWTYTDNHHWKYRYLLKGHPTAEYQLQPWFLRTLSGTKNIPGELS